MPPKQRNEKARPMDRVRSVALENNIGERRSEKAEAAERALILLVEDEDSVRQVAGEILQAEGYLVLEAKNGQEALRLLQREAIAVDVLVTDVVMPGMNGLDLAEELTRRRREMRTIFISGYTQHPLLEKRSMPATAFYLRKPFSVEALTRTVREALARK